MWTCPPNLSSDDLALTAILSVMITAELVGTKLPISAMRVMIRADLPSVFA